MPEIEDAARKVGRYQLIERLIAATAVLLLMVLLAVFVVQNVVLLGRLNDIERVQRQQSCTADAIATFAAAVGEALAAPPAPNPQRNLATAEIGRAAEALRHLDDACG